MTEQEIVHAQCVGMIGILDKVLETCFLDYDGIHYNQPDVIESKIQKLRLGVVTVMSERVSEEAAQMAIERAIEKFLTD